MKCWSSSGNGELDTTDDSYDWIKGEMVRTKIMDDGPALHFVASLGAVRFILFLPSYLS